MLWEDGKSLPLWLPWDPLCQSADALCRPLCCFLRELPLLSFQLPFPGTSGSGMWAKSRGGERKWGAGVLWTDLEDGLFSSSSLLLLVEGALAASVGTWIGIPEGSSSLSISFRSVPYQLPHESTVEHIKMETTEMDSLSGQFMHQLRQQVSRLRPESFGLSSLLLLWLNWQLPFCLSLSSWRWLYRLYRKGPVPLCYSCPCQEQEVRRSRSKLLAREMPLT